jgi:hypothetical protein
MIKEGKKPVPTYTDKPTKTAKEKLTNTSKQVKKKGINDKPLTTSEPRPDTGDFDKGILENAKYKAPPVDVNEELLDLIYDKYIKEVKKFIKASRMKKDNEATLDLQDTRLVKKYYMDEV